MGLIFYPKSKWFVGYEPLKQVLEVVPESVKKVGVFVDETQENVLEIVKNWSLDVVQLHGNETPDYCRQLKTLGITVFKAFSVDGQFDFDSLNTYSGVCDYFLFDTKGKLPGGTGQKFNWQLLENYTGEVPFFLSGGIGSEDLEAVLKFHHPQLFGIDINSGFEISPALKDVEKVYEFIKKVREINAKTESREEKNI